MVRKGPSGTTGFWQLKEENMIYLFLLCVFLGQDCNRIRKKCTGKVWGLATLMANQATERHFFWLRRLLYSVSCLTATFTI